MAALWERLNVLSGRAVVGTMSYTHPNGRCAYSLKNQAPDVLRRHPVASGGFKVRLSVSNRGGEPCSRYHLHAPHPPPLGVRQELEADEKKNPKVMGDVGDLVKINHAFQLRDGRPVYLLYALAFTQKNAKRAGVAYYVQKYVRCGDTDEGEETGVRPERVPPGFSLADLATSSAARLVALPMRSIASSFARHAASTLEVLRDDVATGLDRLVERSRAVAVEKARVGLELLDQHDDCR